jgi:hypothetical protein
MQSSKAYAHVTLAAMSAIVLVVMILSIYVPDSRANVSRFVGARGKIEKVSTERPEDHSGATLALVILDQGSTVESGEKVEVLCDDNGLKEGDEVVIRERSPHGAPNVLFAESVNHR